MLTNVDRYISKFATRVGESTDGRSHYYQIDDKVIRVSDHIGNSSDGSFHIIVRPNGYLIHHPSTSEVNICTYRQVQEFIRCVTFIPSDARCKPQQLIIKNPDDAHVLGVPVEAFTEGQLKGIKLMVQKVAKGLVGK